MILARGTFGPELDCIVVSIADDPPRAALNKTKFLFAVLAFLSNCLAALVGAWLIIDSFNSPQILAVGGFALNILLIPLYMALQPWSRRELASLWIVRTGLLVTGIAPIVAFAANLWRQLQTGRGEPLWGLDPVVLYFVLTGILTLLLAAVPREMRRVLRRNQCRCCGYNLDGLNDLICPECGQKSPRPIRW